MAEQTADQQPGMFTTTVVTYRCRCRCGYEWTPKLQEGEYVRPFTCAKCRSPRWDQQYVRDPRKKRPST